MIYTCDIIKNVVYKLIDKELTCNKLLDEAIKETENLYEGEVFIFKELFKGYVWNRIPRKDCTNVLVDVFKIF